MEGGGRTGGSMQHPAHPAGSAALPAAQPTCRAPVLLPAPAAWRCSPMSRCATAAEASCQASHWLSAQASWCCGAIWCAASCSEACRLACSASSSASGVGGSLSPPPGSLPLLALAALPTSAALSSSTQQAASSSRQRTVLSRSAARVACSTPGVAAMGRRRRRQRAGRGGAAAGVGTLQRAGNGAAQLVPCAPQIMQQRLQRPTCAPGCRATPSCTPRRSRRLQSAPSTSWQLIASAGCQAKGARGPQFAERALLLRMYLCCGCCALNCRRRLTQSFALHWPRIDCCYSLGRRRSLPIGAGLRSSGAACPGALSLPHSRQHGRQDEQAAACATTQEAGLHRGRRRRRCAGRWRRRRQQHTGPASLQQRLPGHCIPTASAASTAAAGMLPPLRTPTACGARLTAALPRPAPAAPWPRHGLRLEPLPPSRAL